MGKMMKKILIVYYSRTGTTRKIADLLKQELNCRTEALIDLKNREGFWGNISGGIDALLKRNTRIRQPEHDPADYDLVIMGTPVWFGNLPPALKTYLVQNREKLPRLAFFCTFSGAGQISAANKFQAFSRQNVRALFIQNNELPAEIGGKIKKFIQGF